MCPARVPCVPGKEVLSPTPEPEHHHSRAALGTPKHRAAMTSCCARNAGERDGAWGLGVRGPPSPGAPGSAAGAAFLTSERRAGARQLPWGSAESGAGRRGLSPDPCTPGRCCRRLPRTLRGPRGRAQRPTGHGWGRPLLPYPCPPRPSPLPAAGGGRGRVSQRRAGGAPGRARPALQNPARASAGPSRRQSRRQSRPACPG